MSGFSSLTSVSHHPQGAIPFSDRPTSLTNNRQELRAENSNTKIDVTSLLEASDQGVAAEKRAQQRQEAFERFFQTRTWSAIQGTGIFLFYATPLFLCRNRIADFFNKSTSFQSFSWPKINGYSFISRLF